MKKVSSGAKVRKIIGNIFVYIILTVLFGFSQSFGLYLSALRKIRVCICQPFSLRNTGSATIRNCLLILT